MILDEDGEEGGSKTPPLPPQRVVRYTLAPLVEDGRHCLACRDVEGMLEEVEFYFGGSPWQRLVRKSDDLFVLVEKGIFRWPALERITRARFRVRFLDNSRAKQITLRPCLRILSETDEANTVLDKWLKKRKFLEEQRVEGKSLE
jgi:hypothetical protein